MLTGYQQEKEPPPPITMGVSTWRRAPDVAMPPRIKTGVNYQVARLARIEGRSRGYEDMILLNEYGRVAESTAACVLMVRDGRVCTPPASEGAMESITADVLAEIGDPPGDRIPDSRVARQVQLDAERPRGQRRRPRRARDGARRRPLVPRAQPGSGTAHQLSAADLFAAAAEY